MLEITEQTEIEVVESQLVDLEPIVAKPGMYEMDAKAYHALRLPSASQLKILRRSPAHLRASWDLPKEETEAMTIGSAVHKWVLENNTFENEYAISKKFDGRTNAGKAEKAEFELANLGKKVLDQNKFQICESIGNSLNNHAVARRLIETKGLTENCIFWEDSETGLLCKGRPDKYLLIDGQLTIADLKTLEDASPDQFSREIFKYGYHIQAAFYLDGVSQVLEEEHNRFLFIAVEKKPPFAVAVYELDEEAIEQGRKEYQSLLRIYKDCLDNNDWPSYNKCQIQSISLPRWAFTN